MAKKARGEEGEITFDFEPVEKVPTTTRASTSVFKAIVDKFVDSGDDAWKVNLEGRKARNIAWGLYRYIKNNDLQDKIKAVVRTDICYLTKV